MLPPEQRLRRRSEFTDVVRRGRRAGRRLLTVHLLTPALEDHTGVAAPAEQAGSVARAGLVVSRAVGGSVVRHRTARRLRHLLRERVPALPPAARLVVRAAPAAGSATSAELGEDLDAALAAACRAERRPGRTRDRTAT